MKDDALLRYSRHILLPQIEYAGQAQLMQSRALVVGAGGLGSPVAMYLAATGIGQLTICDFDEVDLSNLQRQIIHSTKSVGLNKAVSAQSFIHNLNPDIIVHTVQSKSTLQEMAALVAQADVVVDCSDNFATRYNLNKLCFAAKKPLVSGAAIRFEGQITVFNFRETAGGCYNCLYPAQGNEQEMRCADNGVFAPLVGMIGTMQAGEAIKLLLNMGQSLQGRLLLLDALSAEWRTIKLARDPACAVCA